MDQRLFEIRYQAATYSGTRHVVAGDQDEAIQKVKAWVHKNMTLPMYYESYKCVGVS